MGSLLEVSFPVWLMRCYYSFTDSIDQKNVGPLPLSAAVLCLVAAFYVTLFFCCLPSVPFEARSSALLSSSGSTCFLLTGVLADAVESLAADLVIVVLG